MACDWITSFFVFSLPFFIKKAVMKPFFAYFIEHVSVRYYLLYLYSNVLTSILIIFYQYITKYLMYVLFIFFMVFSLSFYCYGIYWALCVYNYFLTIVRSPLLPGILVVEASYTCILCTI